jgi:hypothetical protein
VGLEVSAREIGGKTLVPLLNPLLSSSKSFGVDLDYAIACETASMPNTTHMVRLGYMGVPIKIGFFFGGFEVTNPLIFKGSESNGVINPP